MGSMPLCAILHSPSEQGCLAYWATELSEYDIEYRNKTCAKSQVFADFIVELPTKEARENPFDTTWLLHVDGSLSKKDRAWASVSLHPQAKVPRMKAQSWAVIKNG